MANINYVHPSVSSTITDNSTVYITASGTTKLFAVFTSEKGVDNKIKMMTSVSEFVFNYGEPNMKLYGQTGYNIVNWLNAGGVVYCLRVLPGDAGYANAIVNIQTKVSTKQVLNANGEFVDVDNVELRPCVTYTKVNNKEITDINFNELRRSTDKTVDHYDNNMIFAVIPKGRGSGYNDLGFRINLNDAYDSTYEFRLYDFEVTKTSESGSVSTVQGPFLVSLDPDAMSYSGSSLFIVDVIEKYCDYFTIIFNEDNYEKLAKIINSDPDVHPNRIDVFSGKTRFVDGEYETYYDERTLKNEDIHMSLICYVNGIATDERNIVDVRDEVEAEIASVDTSYRNGLYERHNDSFNRIKKALGVVRKIQNNKGDANNFTSISLDTIKDKDGSNPATLGAGIENLEKDTTVEKAYSDFNDYKDVLETKNSVEGDIGEEDYNIANSLMYTLSSSIDNLLNQMYELYDYSRIGQGSNLSHSSDDYINILDALKNIESNIKNIITYDLNCTRYKNLITNLLEKYTELDISNSNSEKEEFFFEFIGKCEKILGFLDNITDRYSEEDSIKFANGKLTEAESLLNSIKNDYDILTDKYTLFDDYTETMDAAWETIERLLSSTSLVFAINLSLLEYKTKIYNSIENSIKNTKTLIISLIGDIASNIASIKYDTAKTAVDNVKAKMEQLEQNTYITRLQNYDSFINLRYGTDGSIENAAWANNKEIEQLIAKGYSGEIDPSLEDKDQWPIDMVLDAKYPVSIKNAIANLCTEIRNDFIGILDTEDQPDCDKVIEYRKNSISVNNFRLAIFTQTFIVDDVKYTGNNIEVSPTYFLASKIPANDNNYGIHWNFVGPRRGTISGFKSINFLPNSLEREDLYIKQINYVQQDQVSTRFGSQLTSQTTVSALSNISCVRTLLRIQRDVEDLMKNYQFEFNDDITITNAQTALNSYLNQWISNRACDNITGTVYASDYDRQQKLLRVKIELVFNSIIERIAIDLIVNN